MKSLPRSALALFSAVVAFSACSTATHLDQTGQDTFTLTRVPGSGFDRDTDTLKAEVKSDAEKYCEQHGKVLRVVSLTAKKPLYLTGYATATIVFQALPPSDPRLAASLPPPVPDSAAPAPVATADSGQPAPPPTPLYSNQISGDLYTQLLKLDDLRKRGILTQEEFDEEKKKILAKSQ